MWQTSSFRTRATCFFRQRDVSRERLRHCERPTPVFTTRAKLTMVLSISTNVPMALLVVGFRLPSTESLKALYKSFSNGLNPETVRR